MYRHIWIRVDVQMSISIPFFQSLILKGKKRDYQWQLQLNDQHKAATKRRQRTNRMFIAMVVAFSLSWCWSVVFNVFKDYELLPSYVLDQEYIVGISLHCIAMTSTVSVTDDLETCLNIELGQHSRLKLTNTCPFWT